MKDSPNRSRHTTELQYVTQFIDTFSSRFSLESYSSPSSNITANTTSMDPIFHKFVTEYQHSTVGLWPNKSTNGKLSMTPMLTYHEIRSIFNLKPSEMTVLSSGFQLQSLPDLFSKQTTQSLTNSISYHPVLPLEVIMNSSRLQQSISWYSESLLMDAIFIQSMLGYSIKEVDNSIEQTCQILKQILDNGLTYVISQPSAKLIILYPLHRSMIFLQNRYDICTSMDIVSHTTSTLLESSMKPEIIYDSNYTTFHKSHQSYIPLTLQKRIKDFPRIFRNKIQKKLSFRINTNFDYSLHVLREHHGNNCWINSDLEIIWRYLLIQKQFYIFELWYDDTILLAADYCHLSNNNRSIYVATRYHNNSSNEYKTFQSGYLLSSISCQYLQQKGYLLWDLGGIDMCPLMKYKYDLCGESYHRAESFYLLKKLQQYTPSSTDMSTGMSSSSTIPYQGGEVIDEGVIIENITLEDTLWRERDC